MSNWNRWGADDQRGAANLISPELLLGALRVARTGEVVSLADEIRRDRVPVAPVRSAATHLMALDGGDFAAGYRMGESNHGVADDYLFMACQGTTHVDGLGHLWYDDQLYNGFPADRVRSYGATRLGIEQLGHLIGRGVFLDVPALLGVEHLPDAYVIGAAELERCLERIGTEVRSGDIVVIRTGWRRVFDTDPDRYFATSPGIGIEAGRWLVSRDIAAVAADNISIEVQTPHDRFEHDSIAPECHKLLIRDHGIYMLELLNLEEMAVRAPGEFLFVAAPLKIKGGVGSPINPLAVL